MVVLVIVVCDFFVVVVQIVVVRRVGLALVDEVLDLDLPYLLLHVGLLVGYFRFSERPLFDVQRGRRIGRDLLEECLWRRLLV